MHDYFSRRLRDVADVDDCVSEVVTRTLEGIRAGRRPEKLDAWVGGIAWNVVKGRYAEYARRAEEGLPVDLPYQPAEPYLELEQSKIDIEDLLALPSDVEVLMSKRDQWALLGPAIEGIGATFQPIMREYVRLSVERDTLVSRAELAAALDVPVKQLDRQLARAQKATRAAIVALVLARTSRAGCVRLAALLDGLLTAEQRVAGARLSLTPAQSKAVLEHAAGCWECGPRAADVENYQGFSIPSSAASGSQRRVPAPHELPITIYLSDESIHEQVQNAVVDLVTAVGGWIEHADDPVLGSWFRRLRAGARSPVGRELAQVAAHAAESRLVLAHDATVTATMLQNLGPVLTALQPTKDAVVRVGALLIVKVEGVVGVHQLTAAQQLQLDHQPRLATAPHEILAALQLDAAGTTAVDHGSSDIQPC
ncbi:MAG: hypothetical protein M3422_11405 [Actinomycetota bacterium]|nr:hypothetical protein [Actinomycetota bacterium]